MRHPLLQHLQHIRRGEEHAGGHPLVCAPVDIAPELALVPPLRHVLPPPHGGRKDVRADLLGPRDAGLLQLAVSVV